MTVATQRADRVSGVVLGNTWFWPGSLYFRFFSRIMGSGLMQRKILEQNLFVEKLMPPATARKLSDQERPLPHGAADAGSVAMMPKQIIDATPLSERLSVTCPRSSVRSPR